MLKLYELLSGSYNGMTFINYNDLKNHNNRNRNAYLEYFECTDDGVYIIESLNGKSVTRDITDVFTSKGLMNLDIVKIPRKSMFVEENIV